MDKDFELMVYNISGQIMTTYEGTVGVANTPTVINEQQAVKGAYIYLVRMKDYDSVVPLTGTIIISK